MKRLKFKKYLIVLLGIIALSCISVFIYCKPRTNKPNIIIITIDALRPDHLSCYGYQRDTSPNIDRLAGEGVMFTQAITAAGWTAESVPSILTGTYPFIHQVRDWDFPLNPSIRTLPQFLNSKDIRSALITNHEPIDMLDIKDGFDLIYILGRGVVDECRLTLNVIDWIKGNKDKPFFIYLHYHGLHTPYVQPPPYKSKYLYDEFRVKKEVPISEDKDNKSAVGKIPYIIAENNISDVSYYIARYDGAISYVDAQIGRLIDNLEQLNLLDNTLIVLTADHGEMLGEHNIYFSHLSCYESNIKVPLIIRFPRLFPKGKVIPQQVSLIDIAPTILDITKIKAPRYMQGKSLLELFKNKDDLHPYVYVSDHDYISIRSQRWKLICFRNNDDDEELYNLHNDPQEQHNLVDIEQGKFQELKAVLEGYERESACFQEQKTKPLTDEQKDILKSLGYLQ